MDIDFARQQMVQQQIRAWDVLDEKVLDVFASVRREDFVPPGYEALAFAETEIPIGHGEFMLAPVIEGRILQALLLAPSATVLEIGTGTGFLTACLGRLARAVVSIDVYDDFLIDARQRLDRADVGNVELISMDAMQALPPGPFDAVVVSGSIERFDPRFVDVLQANGRLFVVVGDEPAMEARLVTRGGDGEWQSEVLFETSLKPLRHGTLPEQFLF